MSAVAPTLDLSEFGRQIAQSEEQRNQAYTLSRQMQMVVAKTRRAIQKQQQQQKSSAVTEEEASTQTSIASTMFASFWEHTCLQVPSTDTTADSSSRIPRQANLSLRVEDYVRLVAMEHFLRTGRLISPDKIVFADDTNDDDNDDDDAKKKSGVAVTDEEYLAGACMGLAMDLQQHGLSRATVRDVVAVRAARDLVEQILQYLLELDFRNGPLRRRYDGTKYALKGLETILYELAVTTPSSSSGKSDAAQADEKESSEKPKKRAKRSHTAELTLLPTSELMALKERMDHRDNLREQLIKKCRDGQKAAKQSIFALHRGDLTKANSLLAQCLECIQKQLLPLVQEERPLRASGSFCGVLEEYAEAKLFATWLHGKDHGDKSDNDEKSDDNLPAGVLLGPNDFPVALEPAEYLGGLCDLTGEVGRYAVQQGTARNVAAVQFCRETNDSILLALETMERLPGPTGKKMDGLRRSVEKLDRMLYEMSLSEAAGGRLIQAQVDESHGANPEDDTA